jgi:hypothetical protein
VVETSSVSHGTTAVAANTSVLLATDSTFDISYGTGIPHITSSYEGGSSVLNRNSVLVLLLTLLLAALF